MHVRYVAEVIIAVSAKPLQAELEAHVTSLSFTDAGYLGHYQAVGSG